MDLLNQFAAAHPWYFAAASTVAGFCARSFIFTEANARKAVKRYFDWQRAKLKKLGKTDAEIKAVMEDEADFLTSAASEAKAEADASPSAAA